MAINFNEIWMFREQLCRNDSDILVYDEVSDVTWDIVSVLADEDERNYCTSLGRHNMKNYRGNY